MEKIINLLSLLFVSIAVACIIILFSVTSTTKREILKDIEDMKAMRLGLGTIFVDMDDKKDGRPIIGRLTEEDLLLIKRSCKEIKKMAIGALDIPRQCMGMMAIGERKIRGEIYPSVYLGGVQPDYRKIEGLKLSGGRFINIMDEKMKRRVCVLGNTPYFLLGGKNAIGKKVKLSTLLDDNLDVSFTVIGGLARYKPFLLPMSDVFWKEEANINSWIFIPYAVLKEITPEARDRDEGVYISLTPYKPLSKEYLETKDVEGIKEKILSLLREKYGKDKKFFIGYQKQLLEELKSQSHSFTIFILTINLISLFGGIISLSSIMLLSVHNRRSEIGLRRAIGARKKDIFLQFLKEALIITTKGGAVGIILGLFLVWLMGKYTGWDMVIPVYSLFLSIATIALIGVISGVYPAIKAANIPPAIAVKYE